VTIDVSMADGMRASPAAAEQGAAARRAGRLPAWAREPLLHFVLIGAALFAADHVLVARRDDPRSIVVGPQVDQQAREVFSAARGRAPNAEELKALRQVWLDNEVLYREGLALQLDRGDETIRERVIFKALSMVDADVKPPPLDEAGLRAWFQAHRDRYDEPARFDFQEAVLSGDASEGAVRAFVERLNGGAPGELDAGLRVFKGRPHANLVEGYGEDFAHALEAATPGEWRAVKGRNGWRAVRLEAVTPARPATFEPLKGVVMHDWVDATMAERRTAAVRALTKKYDVRYEGAAP
jgi:hypothetical protein